MSAELTIYVVRACSTCHRLAALLADRRVDYESVEYHRTGLTEPQVRDLLGKAGLRARDALRLREPLVAELGLADEDAVGDDRLVELMVEHPRLLQRPIAVRGDRALIARPVERVLELLD